MSDNRGNRPPPLPVGDPPSWRKRAAPQGRGSEVTSGPRRSERSRDRSLGPPARSRSTGTADKDESSLRSRSSSVLGRTSGVAAAGAWAARWEIASILESRCDPSELIGDIKAGGEGDHILSLGQGTPAVDSLRSWSPVKSMAGLKRESVQPREKSKDALWEDESDEWEQDLQKQQAILESLTGERAGALPPWASGRSGAGSAKDTKKVIGPAYAGGGVRESTFSRAATPPPSGTKVLNRPEGRRPYDASGSMHPVEAPTFRKLATPPNLAGDSGFLETDKRDRDRSRRRGRRRDKSISKRALRSLASCLKSSRLTWNLHPSSPLKARLMRQDSAC